MEYTLKERQAIAAGMIKKDAEDLNPDDLSLFCEQLQSLRKSVQQLEYDMDDALRKQVEAAAFKNVNKIRELGIEFKTISIDHIRFYINDEGHTELGSPHAPDDEVPF